MHLALPVYKISSYKVPPVMVSSPRSVVPLAMFFLRPNETPAHVFFFMTKNSLKSNTEILFSFYISPLLWAYCCWPNCLLKLYDTSIFVQCTIQHNWYYLPVLGMITMFISMRTAMNIAFFTFHSYHGKS